MHVSDFVLNHDGIHCAIATPGRDQLGRFLGELQSDDEQTDDCVISIFALVAETICTEDDMSDAGENDCWLTNVSNGDVPLMPHEIENWAMQRYPGAFPEIVSLAEVATYTHQTVEPNEEDEVPLMPSQSGSTLLRESSAEVLHRPVGYDMTWLSLGDLRTMRGRSHHNDKRLWWKQLAEVRRQNKAYDVLATNAFTFYMDWWNELISEDIENGEVVIAVFRNDYYYEHLLVASHVTKKLRTHWLYEYGEYEYEADDRHYDDYYRFDDEVDPNDQAYYAGEFYRKPVWIMWDEYLHQEPVNHHGWHGYERELRLDALAQLYLGDMDFRDAMNDDYARGLDMFQHRRDDDEEEAETLSQHGGPRGWKAAAVSTERLMEATI